MIGDVARIALNEKAAEKALFTRVVFSFDNTPLEDNKIYSFSNEKKKLTNCIYTIRYFPFLMNQRKFGKGYAISCDLLCNKKNSPTERFNNWEEFKSLSQTRPDIKWLIENTDISKSLFDLARDNFRMPIPFAVNWVKYSNNLKKQQGLNIKDRKPMLRSVAMDNEERDRMQTYLEKIGQAKKGEKDPRIYTREKV